jgi:hypothetical protein
MRDDDHEAARAERLRVFLCHSADDKPQVRELYQRLRNDGFQPWLDEEDLLVGQDWEREIEKAVRASHVVIICLSRNSVSKTGYVQKEILVALEAAERQPEGANFILPVRLEPCEIPQRLHTRHCANLFEKDGYSRLTKALWAYARDRGLSTPESEVKSAARGATAKAGAAVLFSALVIIIGLSFKNCGGEKAVAIPADNSTITHLLPSEPVRPGPVLQPTPLTEKTPEPVSPTPTPTPTPAPPKTEVGRVNNKNDATPVSPGDNKPPAPRPSSSLGRYRIDIFLTRDSRRQTGFAKEIGRQLKPHVREVTFSKEPFKPVTGCQALYLYAGKDDPLNEDAAADVLVKLLNDTYPNVSFQGTAVADKTTPRIITLVLGFGCKK